MRPQTLGPGAQAPTSSGRIHGGAAEVTSGLAQIRGCICSLRGGNPSVGQRVACPPRVTWDLGLTWWVRVPARDFVGAVGAVGAEGGPAVAAPEPPPCPSRAQPAHGGCPCPGSPLHCAPSPGASPPPAPSGPLQPGVWPSLPATPTLVGPGGSSQGSCLEAGWPQSPACPPARAPHPPSPPEKVSLESTPHPPCQGHMPGCPQGPAAHGPGLSQLHPSSGRPSCDNGCPHQLSPCSPGSGDRAAEHTAPQEGLRESATGGHLAASRGLLGPRVPASRLSLTSRPWGPRSLPTASSTPVQPWGGASGCRTARPTGLAEVGQYARGPGHGGHPPRA